MQIRRAAASLQVRINKLIQGIASMLYDPLVREAYLGI